MNVPLLVLALLQSPGGSNQPTYSGRDRQLDVAIPRIDTTLVPDGRLDEPVWRRAALLAGNRIAGPALIEEHASTTVLMPGDRMAVDAYGNLVIRVAGAKR